MSTVEGSDARSFLALPTCPDKNRDQEQDEGNEELWRCHSVPCHVSRCSYPVGLGFENGGRLRAQARPAHIECLEAV